MLQQLGKIVNFANEKERLFKLLTNNWSSRGGGQVVSVITFNSDDPSLNPAEAYSFFCKICVWKRTKRNKKEAVVGPFKKQFHLVGCA